jgi:hypothetical protein
MIRNFIISGNLQLTVRDNCWDTGLGSCKLAGFL